MADVSESRKIRGVYLVTLQPFADSRGRFLETFRKEWVPGARDMIQTNRSDSVARVLRGLHFHRHQADYWYVARGSIRAALCDLRPGSSTHRATEVVEMSESSPWGLYIPPGVAHGFYAVTDATMIYLVDRYYDPSDELGVLWNDPDLGIDWGADDPILSERDRSNVRLQEIPPHLLPAP